MGRPSSSAKREPSDTGGFILWRPKVWGVLVVLLSIGIGAHFAWQRFAPVIAHRPQYLISAERIQITPPPSWIRADIKAEVLRNAGLIGSLSVLDDAEQLEERVRNAFSFHPWVAEVRRITLGLPASMQVELEYRRPVAVVAAADGQAVSFLPVDTSGIRLPHEDFSDVELRHMPRIVDVTGYPVVGAAWNDPRVVGGAQLAAGLTDVWDQLRLVEIIPSQHPQVRGDEQFYTFEMITSGGTRVAWGAAPGREADAGESPFDVKRRRILDYATDQGRLDSIDGPELVDVRHDLVVVPRTARREGVDSAVSSPK
jgi:hypothetical protein